MHGCVCCPLHVFLPPPTKGMMGAYGPPYMPMQGSHEGLLSVAPMPPHPAGGPHLPPHHLGQGMPGYPGMLHQGKGRLSQPHPVLSVLLEGGLPGPRVWAALSSLPRAVTTLYVCTRCTVTVRYCEPSSLADLKGYFTFKLPHCLFNLTFWTLQFLNCFLIYFNIGIFISDFLSFFLFFIFFLFFLVFSFPPSIRFSHFLFFLPVFFIPMDWSLPNFKLRVTFKTHPYVSWRIKSIAMPEVVSRLSFFKCLLQCNCFVRSSCKKRQTSHFSVVQSCILTTIVFDRCDGPRNERHAGKSRTWQLYASGLFIYYYKYSHLM